MNKAYSSTKLVFKKNVLGKMVMQKLHRKALGQKVLRWKVGKK